MQGKTCTLGYRIDRIEPFRHPISDFSERDSTMKRLSHNLLMISGLLVASSATAADWKQYRGPGGLGTSHETGLPVKWSSDVNVAWRTELPGPGTSSPIVLGDRVYLTCYTSYGLKPNEGDKNDLMRHMVCVHRKTGKILWRRDFTPQQPESTYSAGNDSQHGYSSSTPTTDGRRLYVFFGKSGLYCLDLQGKQLWHASVGSGVHGWGSSNSPVLYKELVIVNASVESSSLVALNKLTGKEVWRVGGIRSSWNTPLLVDLPEGGTELVVSESKTVLSFDPGTGKELWRVGGFGRYVCPSVVAHKGVVHAVRDGSVAIRAGGRGDVTDSRVAWRIGVGSLVPSPVYHNGHLYWVRGGGTAHCVDASNGEIVYRERLSPKPGIVYASVIVADGKLYYVTQRHGVYVLAAKPKFEQLAHNVFEDDGSRTNASPVAHNGQLLMRTDRYLYCIGTK
jgi:hypothetical protein